MFSHHWNENASLLDYCKKQIYMQDLSSYAILAWILQEHCHEAYKNYLAN